METIYVINSDENDNWIVYVKMGVSVAVILGTSKVGETLIAKANKGATSLTFTLQEAQKSKFIRVLINGATSSTEISTQTKAVESAEGEV